MADRFCYRYIFTVLDRTDIQTEMQAAQASCKCGGRRNGVCWIPAAAGDRHDGWDTVSGFVCRPASAEGCFFFSDKRNGCKNIYLYQRLRTSFRGNDPVFIRLSAGNAGKFKDGADPFDQYGGDLSDQRISVCPQKRQAVRKALYGEA